MRCVGIRNFLFDAFLIQECFESTQYEDHEGEETYDGVPQQVQSNQSTPFIPNTLELEELVDGENAKKDGLQSMVDMGDGKRIHKAKVLHEFTRFTRTSNLTDCLRHVANISRFVQPVTMPHHHIGDDSITETECLLIEDPIAVLLRCEGIPFLGIAQVNSIKIDKVPQSVVSKDLLCEETISIGVQILCLKSRNITLPNGTDTDWVWEHGQDSFHSIPGKFVQQINPEVVEMEDTIGWGIGGIGEGDAMKKTVGYGFQSDELRELAGSMFGRLSLEDQRRIVEIRQTENFPYHFNGEWPAQQTLQ